jgi:hypothetical protein
MVIRHIGVWSVSRLAGALYAAMGLLVGAVIALVAMLGGMAGAMNNSGGSFPPAFGALFGVGAIIFLPVCYGLLGLVVGAITTALYNLFAGMFGGIQLDTEP